MNSPYGNYHKAVLLNDMYLEWSSRYDDYQDMKEWTEKIKKDMQKEKMNWNGPRNYQGLFDHLEKVLEMKGKETIALRRDLINLIKA